MLHVEPKGSEQVEQSGVVELGGIAGLRGEMAVDLAAVQIAAHLGATPIAVTRTGTKTDRLLAAGAAHVTASERFQAAHREIHGPPG
ncbi:hypothetical protein ABGB18_44340 [Nonomuraea sp. B12E4]|uniref:hypothetical protein n=1 Tax=Nonomuraea sp. B12E4 TaxID=3153564 RepID=UPI00325E3DBB